MEKLGTLDNEKVALEVLCKVADYTCRLNIVVAQRWSTLNPSGS